MKSLEKKSQNCQTGSHDWEDGPPLRVQGVYNTRRVCMSCYIVEIAKEGVKRYVKH